MTQEQSAIDPQRRAGLRQARLSAVIRSRWTTAELVVPSGVGAPGPALIDQGPPRRGWVLVDPGTPGALGGALTWGLRHAVDALIIIVDDTRALGAGDPSAAVLARRGAQFRSSPEVWQIAGKSLEPVDPAPYDRSASEIPPDVASLADVMRAHGVDPVVEHRVLLGEVLGLEVARSVADDDGPRLEVGVGHHDRQARAEMRPGQSLGAALDEVVAVVRRWRAPGAERHPANLLARERWLRSLVMGRPDLVGARWLDPVAPILPRGDLRRAVPAVAAGMGFDGRKVIVVCSSGVDLDVVPVAADHRYLAGGTARLVLVVARGDDVRATRDMVEDLIVPAEILAVPTDWASVLTG